MKKKLFCIFGLILIVSAIAYFCHDHSVLPLDAENANYISFKIYPQNEPNYMVTNDDRVKEIVRAINELKDEGHQVGGHSYTHIRLDSADVAALAEIQKTDETLRAILGDGDYWLRPPWGFASDALKSAVSVPLIYWTIDTMDWSVRNRDLVAHHIIENAKSGDIVLLHDPYDTSVEAALQTIDVLSEQGYEFVTLEELFSNAGVTPQAGHFYLRADEEVPW